MSVLCRNALLSVAIVLAFSDALADGDAAKACTALTEPMARLACYDRALGRPADPTFGLPPAPRAAAEAATMTSQINGGFDGWQASTRWTLANGQVWAIADGSSSGYPLALNPKVEVQRGAFGAYFIVIAGVAQSPRVRRLR